MMGELVSNLKPMSTFDPAIDCMVYDLLNGRWIRWIRVEM
jgi:hypothetical protein